jgi:hypothetical protein
MLRGLAGWACEWCTCLRPALAWPGLAHACVLPIDLDEAALCLLVPLSITPGSKTARLPAHHVFGVAGGVLRMVGQWQPRWWLAVMDGAGSLVRGLILGDGCVPVHGCVVFGALGVQWVSVERKWEAVAGRGCEQQGLTLL